MTDTSTVRMLLSHNFNLYNGELPALNREQFAEVFSAELTAEDTIQCCFIENPHWIVEIIFPIAKYSPREIGDRCAQILNNKRQQQKSPEQKMPDILVLGGKKTTPSMSNSPTALQPGEWGVDVVETPDKTIFLESIQWETLTTSKPQENIFKIEIVGNK